MSEDEPDSDNLLRQFYLWQVCRQGEVFDIDGINFDLNHPDLDRREWEPIRILGDLPGSPLEPLIAFPWTEDDDLVRMRKRCEPPRAESGDQIVIWSVEAYSAPPSSLGKLDHPHHQERRIIRLGLLKPGRQVVEVPGFWIFVGVADVITPIFLNDSEGVRSALVSRFEQMTGLEDLLDNVAEVSEAEWNARFEAADYEVKLAARMLWKAEDEFPNNSAMAFGYLIGRAEGRQGRKAQAKSASKAPRKTGDPARAEAIKIVDASPRIILRRCAEQVAEALGKSTRSIEDTIAVLFTKGEDGVSRPDLSQIEHFRALLAARPSDGSL